MITYVLITTRERSGISLDDALGLLEIFALTPSLVALDAIEKAGNVRVLQAELNDAMGVVLKIAGAVAAVRVALDAGVAVAGPMGGKPIAAVIPRAAAGTGKAAMSRPEFNPLIQQDVVFIPTRKDDPVSETQPRGNNSRGFALGLIETQGFTAVYEAVDRACKAADVEVVGKEKLGGGYITVVVRGDVAAVNAAVEAARDAVGELGKLIAAHVIARPSPGVLALLPTI